MSSPYWVHPYCACYKCWPNSNSVKTDVICQSEIIVNVSSMCGEPVCFCQKVTKEMNYRCVFGNTVALYIFIHRFMIYWTYPLKANAMEAAMFVSYPTAPLCKTQHDWMTASQHPLRFQKYGSPFQNVMNISTLSNALVNIREELWLADSDIPPLRKKCSGQAGFARVSATVCWDPGWRGWFTPVLQELGTSMVSIIPSTLRSGEELERWGPYWAPTASKKRLESFLSAKAWISTALLLRQSSCISQSLV